MLVKGRRNYLSRRRLEIALSRAASLFSREEELEQLRQLRDWAKETTDGSLSDLDFKPQPSVWDEVASDNGNCLGRHCPHYKDCFYFRARRRMQNAQILIVNHALFFSDLALRRSGGSILPKYDAVIFDEAHTLEAVAGEHLGIGVTSGQVQYILNKLYNDRTNKGLLVYHHLAEAQRETLDCATWPTTSSTTCTTGCRTERRQRPRAAARVVRQPAQPGPGETVQAGPPLRREHRGRQPAAGPAGRLRTAAGLGQRDRDLAQAAAAGIGVLGRGRHVPPRPAAADAWPPRRSTWGRRCTRNCFSGRRTVILTSATLAVGRTGSFDFFKSRIGLTQAAGLRLDSPFDYRRQAQLILVDGMPDPARSGRNTRPAACG